MQIATCYLLQPFEKHAPLEESSLKLVTYSRHKVVPLGVAKMKCEYKTAVHKLEFQIIEAILGGDSCTQMGLIKRIYKVDREEETDILREYKDVFTGLGCVPGQHHIQTDPAVALVSHPPRKVPLALEKLGVLEKQTELTDWVNSMGTVQKPNKRLKICIDPQVLNKAIKREHYPLRRGGCGRMPKCKILFGIGHKPLVMAIQLDEGMYL